MRLVLQATGLGMLYLLLGATAALGDGRAGGRGRRGARGGRAARHGAPAGRWPSSWTACSWAPPCGCWPATGCCSCWSSGSAGRRRDLAGAGLAVLAAVHVARAGLLAGQRTVLARTVWPLAWRHLQVPGLRCRRSGRSRAGPAGALDAARRGPRPARGGGAAAGGGRGGPVRWLLAGLGLSAVLALAVGVPLAARVRALPARTRDDVLAAVRAAVRGPRAAGRHLLRWPAVEHPRPQRLGAGAGAAGRAGAGARPPAGAPRPAGQHAAAGRVAAPARGRRGPGRAVDRARDVPHQHHPEQPPDPRPRHHRRVRRAR